MAEMTVNGKEVLQNLTISVRMPRAFSFRMRLTTAILALARKLSPVELEAEVIEGAKQLRLPGDLQRLDLKPGDRFVLSVDRPISMEMCDRIQKLWRDFIGDDSEHRLMVLDASIELSVINVEAKSEIRSMGESQYSVRFYENCGHSPAWPLVPRAMIDLEDRGFDFQPHVLPMWNDPCMAAISDDGSPMGFLIYRYDEVNCSWFVMLAYVVPEHRRTGVHTALFSALVDRAKQRGDILSIYCGTHVNNTAAQAAFEAQGRAKKAIMYSFHLKDWADGKEPTEVAQ